MRLTDVSVRAIQPPPKGAKVHYCDTLTGFGVRVTSTGVKAFVLTYGANRERRTLGRYPTVSLADARSIAKGLLAERTLGKYRPARLRASEALTRFLKERESQNKASTLKITEALIRNHFPRLLEKNLEDVRTDDVTAVTDRLLKNGQPSAAAHAFTAVRTFLKWCVKRRYIQHSPTEALDKPGHAATRERVLTDDELRAVWVAAGEVGKPFGDIVRLLILTGQRRSEIGGLLASYISDNQICLPSEITKNRRAHTFPIGALAATILSSNITTGTTILFPARGKPDKPFNGWSKAKAQLDQKIAKGWDKLSPPFHPWTLHDLRRSYATCLQKLGVRIEVIEALLNHVSGTRAGIVGVYQRHRFETEMREAISTYEAWFRATVLQIEEY